MLLMSEHEGLRVYLGADEETWYEVRMERRFCRYTMSKAQYESLAGGDSSLELIEKNCLAQLSAWFAGPGDDLGCEPIGQPSGGWATELIDAQWNDDQDPAHPSEPVELMVYSAGQQYWPPAPVDTVTAEPGSGALEDPMNKAATLGELRRKDPLRGNRDPRPDHEHRAAVRKMRGLLPDGESVEQAHADDTSEADRDAYLRGDEAHFSKREEHDPMDEVLAESRALLEGLKKLYPGQIESQEGTA